MKISPLKLFWLILGFICFALGTIGVFLPVLPTVPFYLLTAFSFAKSSERLHTWFTNTKLYKKHLESFVKKEGMTVKTKLSIMFSVSMMMGIGFFLMARKQIWVPCIILALVWMAHIIFFCFFVKTIHPPRSLEQIEKKREKEEYVVKEMIRLYCRKNHKEFYDRKKKKLCPECDALANYSVERSEKCPNMQTKNFCSSCKTHCYKPEMREKIRAVMRFSGPRIMFYHPILAMWHVACTIKQNKEAKHDKSPAD